MHVGAKEREGEGEREGGGKAGLCILSALSD